MIKIVAFLHRNPELSPEAFRDYWVEVHVPMIKSRLPHLSKYTGSFPLSPAEAGFDAIVELGFPDRATMEADMNAPAFLADDRQRSSAHLMDMTRMRSVVLEEINVPLGG